MQKRNISYEELKAMNAELRAVNQQLKAKMEDGLVVTKLDISERKQAEKYLRKSEERLRMFVTASSDLVYQMSADWEKMYPLEFSNFLLKTEAPPEGWKNRYIPIDEQELVQITINEAILHRKVFELEHRVILANGNIGWVYSKAIPLLNEQDEILEWFGIASDITARKLSEEERDRNYLLLQQSEDVAGTGTWDYDLLTGNFNWSDGMYRLFEIQKGKAVRPDIYQEYATTEYQDIAKRITDHIKLGDAGFEEMLTINIGGHIKALKLKASVIYDDQGLPVRVLGVDLDATANHNAENRLKQIETEQQLKIFRATLRTQEEERRRISESLHNGLGQMLYAIKISMNHISLNNALTHPEKFSQSKSYTEELVTGAIQESRKISHELMPMTLEQFGLRSAIEDVCKQLNGNVKFNCSFTGPKERLEKYLELAVFRTVQELILNVVKHAEASVADIAVTIGLDHIKMIVRDNGKGMPKTLETKTGIGLTSIRSKIKLLNGTVDVNSGNGTGTEITVQIPIGTR